MAILVTLIDTKLVVQFSVRDDTVLILVVTDLSDSESVGRTPRGMWLGDASVTRGTIATPGERQIFGDELNTYVNRQILGVKSAQNSKAIFLSFVKLLKHVTDTILEEFGVSC